MIMMVVPLLLIRFQGVETDIVLIFISTETMVKAQLRVH